MRKKKNCDARMERCSDIWIKEPEKYKGKWAGRFGNDNPIHIEIGCGKGNFIVGMAKMYPYVNFIQISLQRSILASQFFFFLILILFLPQIQISHLLYYNNNFFTIYFSNILKITKKSDAYASDFNIVL